MRNLFSHLLLIHGGRDTKDNASKSYPDISEEKEETRGVSTWRKRHIFFIKCVCLIVAFIFAHQQLGWTQGGKPVWVYARPDHSVNHRSSLPGKNIEVPYDAAGIQEAALDGGDDVIVHIQDAHSSLSAQYSIVKLLNSLVADYDLDFIALEGAKGYIDTSILKTFPDKDIRRKTADLLMREGRMSAGEFFEITNDKDILLYGVEDDDLYRKNVLEFREVAGARAHLVGMVGAFLDQTKALEEK
ncbi:MAG: hypothetical protein KJ995_02850, partial [Candidatus Omnitrophica bacterium]|nr:hypothetical protein [Candidatus Omnitrophota bacterium]MBU1128100.1 hypothetical protein [Candidatus Omnitrophota bacterium]MBU1851326.1 hypothetical protein [Candidatus Omnitrophota bacterium]